MEARIEMASTEQMTLELARDRAAPGRARAALDGLDGALKPDKLDAARLLVSELVTNAVKYGGDGPVRVHAAIDDGVLRTEVVDDGSGFALVQRDTADLETPGGWGLHLVGELADRWGAYEGSTHVWFEIRLDA
jgi:anti-sigma regulatory factor (Ser/Thr protein kinase)